MARSRSTVVDADLVELCDREHARLVGALALLTGDRGIAEELAQEAMIRLHQHWPRVREMQAPAGWLHGVGANLARSWWRRRHAERRAYAKVGPVAEVADVGAEPADVLAIRRAVSILPTRQRTAVVLRHFVGLPVAEVAAQMSCAEGTVKALTSQGLDRLRVLIVESPEVDLRA
jgi:RNA polymerase sigma-70 factor (ECF subfamily)